MKFAQAVMTLLLFSRAATAWTQVAAVSHRRAAAAAAFAASSSLKQQQRTYAAVLPPLHQSTAAARSALSTEVLGAEATESFRLKFKRGEATVSPWHDIPLQNEDGSYNMVRCPDGLLLCLPA
jgi:hypothetical protein